MNRIKRKTIVIVFASILTGLILVSFTNKDFKISKSFDIFFTLFKELNLHYVDEIDPEALIKTSIDEMLQSLDPYTVYIPESEMDDFRFMVTGEYGGIGALIRKKEDYVIIAEPYEGFPAHLADLRAGDLILEINGKSAKALETTLISNRLKGPPNTSLELLIKRPGVDKEIKKSLIRKNIKIDNVSYYGILKNGVGYILLSGFTEGATKEMKQAFLELKKKHNIKSLIIDMRGNPGGTLIESVWITNLFVEKGEEIVSTKGKIEKLNTIYEATNTPIDTKMPIAILVNSRSASAAEIVSGAMQDLDRAIIIGKRTFGKGLVQKTRNLSYNTKLKVTTAKYYIPSGRCIQALDYSHRNEDGSVGKIPDSLITEYSTKHGRKVYDGGGIVPDIVTENEQISNLGISLLVKSIIFDYATLYRSQHDTIAGIDDFYFSDDDYQDFLAFLEGKDFDYKTKSEEKLRELQEAAKREKYYDSAVEEFERLKEKLAHDKYKDLEIFKEEIKELLKEEIIVRYYFQKGRIKAAINNDPAIDKAISVLQDSIQYYSILNINSTEIAIKGN